MARERIVPPYGPLVVQTSIPASARDRPPSHTSADKTSAVQRRRAIVLAAIEFAGTLMDASSFMLARHRRGEFDRWLSEPMQRTAPERQAASKEQCWP